MLRDCIRGKPGFIDQIETKGFNWKRMLGLEHLVFEFMLKHYWGSKLFLFYI